MSYTYDRVMKDTHIDDAETRVREALANKGFGVLTEIDVKATMKKKLDADMPPYHILWACNPGMAHKAIEIEIEPRIGAMLPCNVILRPGGCRYRGQRCRSSRFDAGGAEPRPGRGRRRSPRSPSGRSRRCVMAGRALDVRRGLSVFRGARSGHLIPT